MRRVASSPRFSTYASPPSSQATALSKARSLTRISPPTVRPATSESTWRSTRADAPDGFESQSPIGAARARHRDLRNVLARAERIPVAGGELSEVMLSETSVALAPDVARVFGRDATQASVARAMTLGLPGVEVKPRDFILVDNKAEHDPDARTRVTAIGVCTDLETDETRGYFARTFYLDGRGARRDYFDWICTDPNDASTRGLGRAIYENLDAFAQGWGSERTLASAAWLGRYVWPMRGYDFADSKTREEAQRRFSAFKTHHHLKDDELVFVRHDGRSEAFHSDRLQHARDFAELRSTERKLTMPMWLAENEVETLSLDVGRAFLLCDLRESGLESICMPEYAIAREVAQALAPHPDAVASPEPTARMAYTTTPS